MARRSNSTLESKMVAKLQKKFGMEEDQASEIVKSLAPLARHAIKTEVGKEISSLASKAEEVAKPEVSFSNLKEVKETEVVPVEGAIGASILQKMDGISRAASYVVAAVKGEVGIIAAKKDGEHFKVKFYPNAPYWGVTADYLHSIGTMAFAHRTAYDRFYIPYAGFHDLINKLMVDGAPFFRVKELAKRMRVAVPDAIEEVLQS